MAMRGSKWRTYSGGRSIPFKGEPFRDRPFDPINTLRISLKDSGFIYPDQLKKGANTFATNSCSTLTLSSPRRLILRAAASVCLTGILVSDIEHVGQ
jgi:hypothetical protein